MKKVLIGSLTGIFSGLFGAGGGAVLVIMLQKYLKVEVHKSHATAIAIVLPITIACSFVYIHNLLDIEWLPIFYISLGGIIGGHIGARYLKKMSNDTLHKIFGIFLIVAAIRMIF